MGYPNIRAEMARKNITVTMLARDPEINCTVGTMSRKLSGKDDLKCREIKAIKRILQTNLTIDEMLEESED